MLLIRLCKAIVSADYQRCLGCGRPINPLGDLPTCNDCPAGTSDHLDKDVLHAAIMEVMKEKHFTIKEIANGPDLYDPNFGDDKKCVCGDSYFRHFDWAEDWAPVGCKYTLTCGCTGFKLNEES